MKEKRNILEILKKKKKSEDSSESLQITSSYYFICFLSFLAPRSGGEGEIPQGGLPFPYISFCDNDDIFMKVYSEAGEENQNKTNQDQLGHS